MESQYHHGKLREALVKETLLMVEANEGHLIGFRELARRLGVSRSAPYRHFDSVENLLAAVVEKGFITFLSCLNVVVEKDFISEKEKFYQLGTAYVEFAIAHPNYYRLMFDKKFYIPNKHSIVEDLSTQSFGILKEQVKRCLGGQSSTEEQNNLATLSWACVHGISKLFIDGQLAKISQPSVFIKYSCRKFLELV